MKTNVAAVVSLLLTGLAAQGPALADGPAAPDSSIFAPKPLAPKPLAPRPVAPKPLAPKTVAPRPATIVSGGDQGLGLEQFGLAAAGTVLRLASEFR